MSAPFGRGMARNSGYDDVLDAWVAGHPKPSLRARLPRLRLRWINHRVVLAVTRWDSTVGHLTTYIGTERAPITGDLLARRRRR